MVKGSHMTVEQCAVNSSSHMGLHMSLAARAKLSARMMGTTKSPEWRAKLAIASLINMTPERKAKLLATHLDCPSSPETKERLSIAMFGEKNPAWRGGVTSENRRARYSPEYILWRTAVFERDDYTCQDCGQRGGDLEAHHIHGFASYPDERFVIANGATLCLACHNKTKGIRTRLTPEEV